MWVISAVNVSADWKLYKGFMHLLKLREDMTTYNCSRNAEQSRGSAGAPAALASGCILLDIHQGATKAVAKLQ